MAFLKFLGLGKAVELKPRVPAAPLKHPAQVDLNLNLTPSLAEAATHRHSWTGSQVIPGEAEFHAARSTDAFIAGGADGMASVDGPHASGAVLTRAKAVLKGNQDGILVGVGGENPHVAVADEAGGAGKVNGLAGGSSHIALEEYRAFAAKLEGAKTTAHFASADLLVALNRANDRILETGSDAKTTFAGAIKVKDEWLVAAIGDSQLTIFRANGDVAYRAEEGTPGVVGGEQVFKAGVEQKDVSKQQIGLGLAAMLSAENALGVESPQYRFKIIKAEPGDRVVVTSDGFGDGRLKVAQQRAGKNELQTRWSGDQMFKLMRAAMKESVQESLLRMQSLIDRLTRQNKAKPDDVAIGILQLK